MAKLYVELNLEIMEMSCIIWIWGSCSSCHDDEKMQRKRNHTQIQSSNFYIVDTVMIPKITINKTISGENEAENKSFLQDRFSRSYF